MKDKILVVAGPAYAEAIHGLGKIVTDPAKFFNGPEEFKLVLFTGGEDVNPVYYKDSSPKDICRYNDHRDKYEIEIFKTAYKYGILMTGICRGLQFLNVMAGGRMMHHIEEHGCNIHLMKLATGEQFYVNSFHHQMILPAGNTKIVGWSTKRLSKTYIGNFDEKITYRGRENEAAIFPDIKGFGVQYHPEIMPKSFEAYDYYYKMVANALKLPWETFIRAYTKGADDVTLVKINEHSSAVGG